MRILLFAKNHAQVMDLCHTFSNGNNLSIGISTQSDIAELNIFISYFKSINWSSYLTCLEYFDSSKIDFRYTNIENCISKNKNLNELNNLFDVIIFRKIGSVEGQREKIYQVIRLLKDSFNKIIINDPETIKYGLRKDYIFELQKYSYPVIPSLYFEKSVDYITIISQINSSLRYIIKPITGELSNSVTQLDDVDDSFLRRKEDKVGGWIVQPFIKEIWDGEYQLIFLGDTFSHGIVKKYNRTEYQDLPNQNDRVINEYNPNLHEIETALHIKDFFKNNLKKNVIIFRIDYIKIQNGSILILEVEIVNPGFFWKHIKESKIQDILSKFKKMILTFKT